MIFDFAHYDIASGEVIDVRSKNDLETGIPDKAGSENHT
jgi:hypothetical protein